MHTERHCSAAHLVTDQFGASTINSHKYLHLSTGSYHYERFTQSSTDFILWHHSTLSIIWTTLAEKAHVPVKWSWSLRQESDDIEGRRHDLGRASSKNFMPLEGALLHPNKLSASLHAAQRPTVGVGCKSARTRETWKDMATHLHELL